MRRASLVLVGFLVAACVEKGPEIDPNFVKTNLLSTDPTPKHVVNGDLGGKVIYLGADVNKAQLRPGDKFTIVHYWKVVQAPGSEWRVFSHVNGGVKEDWMNIDGSKMRSQHGPASWKAGEVVRDEQSVQLRKDWRTPFATIHVGLYKRGATSDRDRMPIVSGPSDSGHRLIALKLPVVGAASKPGASDQGPYVIARAQGPIAIDGKADEPSWGVARATGAFQDAEGGRPVGSATNAKLLYDDQFLYAFVHLDDPDVYSSYKKNDDTLWKEDVIELFIDADQNRRGYVELQVNPNNAQLDSWFAATRAQGGGDLTWSSGMKSAVVVQGTADKRDDADRGWEVEIAIPLEAVKGNDKTMKVELPPKPGDRWRLNIVRGDKPKDQNLAASAWAKISISDFHAIDRLNEVAFGDEKGQLPKTVAPVEAAAAPTDPATKEAVAKEPAVKTPAGAAAPAEAAKPVAPKP